VLRALQRAGTLAVIDETFVELNLDGVNMPPPAAALAGRGQRTITIGSLSKAVWGGLRIGWARADPALIHRLATIRASSDLASPLFEQIAAASAIERLDEILAERREVIRIRRAALTRAIDERLPTWSYRPPSGGLFLWARLPAAISTSLSLEASRRDLLVTPGPRFAAGGLLERHLRLPFTLAPEQLDRAVDILAELTPAGTRARGSERLEYVA
jgi:DNA-binding transcriptional MocR family regulator